MASDPLFDEIAATTLQEIYPDVIQDEYFKGAPFLAYLRDHCLVPFEGGAFMQNDFTYAPLIGGFYDIGKTFVTAKPQTIGGMALDPKKCYVNITEYLEDLRITNKGELAVFSMVDTDLRTGMHTMNALWNIAVWNHGQTISGSDRHSAPNGIEEVFNNGYDPSYYGNVFTSYGNQTRNGNVGAALNGWVYYGGTASGALGMITYAWLVKMYLKARRGNQAPNLSICNKTLFSFMLQRIQTQQRFGIAHDVIWGADGIQIMDCNILVDDYAPSTADGVNDPLLGNYLTSSFVVPSGITTWSNLPVAGTTAYVGEVLAMFNTDKMLFRVVNDEMFGFGFKPFLMTGDNTRVCGQELSAANLQNLAPWSGIVSYGWGS